ncbi:MAG: hypothetical protein HY958_10205 [Bacteroidia bacterium]|nr:hypothetical protein [Bacteroidia bacterium]
MKPKSFLFIIAFAFVMLSGVEAYAQSPQLINYQAVARNTGGQLIINQNISVRISILSGSPAGTAEYSETHAVTTNQFGIFTIQIGGGTVVSGSFAAISWSAASHYVKVEADETGGSNYQLLGTSQLISVPYSLYSEKSGKAMNDQDTSATNELQQLSINNYQLSISNGNTVALPTYSTGTGIQITGNTITNTAPNQMQVLSISNDTLYLSNGGFVKLPPATGTTVFKDSEFAVINETSNSSAPITACVATLAGQGAGNVDNGTHDYKISFYKSTSETVTGPASNSVTVVFNGTDGKISLTNIPISSDPSVIGRKIYRRFYPAGQDYKLVTTIADNTTTTFTDNISYSNLGSLAQGETKFLFITDCCANKRMFIKF